MKKRLFTALIFFFLVSGAKAQYVTISDSGMVSWLTANYPSAMMGNQMDTTNSIITSETQIVINMPTIPIINFYGIQFFDSLTFLSATNAGITIINELPQNLEYINLNDNYLTVLPSLPNNLLTFGCQGNQIQIIPTLPNSLVYLYCGYNSQLTQLPNLPGSLQHLYCEGSALSNLPILPSSLIHLSCGGNNLTTLPILPSALQELNCSNNPLGFLPQIPNSLQILNCSYSKLTILPTVLNNLNELYCSNNNLTILPTLSNNLNVLDCSSNFLTTLPILPDSLTTLACSNNNLTTLPNIPDVLILLYCSSNNLTTLPNLPNTLLYLNCGGNSLTTLPVLPDSLIQLDCNGNFLTSLPQLPFELEILNINSNVNLSCLPLLPESLNQMGIVGTNLSCLPSYPFQVFFGDFQGLPLCLPNNPNGCITTGSISGAVFHDANNDCINNSNLTIATTFHLYDDQNNFLQSRSSSFDDNYYFSIQPGGYSVRIDSSFFSNSVTISCPVSGEHSVVAIIDSSYIDRDFGFQCAGKDLGVEAIVQQGIVFPGQAHSVKAILGDLSQYFGLNCASGTGGTVQINITGPINYTGYPTTALAPIVNGNSYSYTITDFGAISIDESFVLNFLTDTTAQAGNSILVTATITSDSLDLDSTNNSLSYTYFVVNSYDPNMKEVNPVNVLPGYEDYFTYTVHFQNLGSAPAFNIRIKDTIDGNLNLQTLRVINASHNYTYNLNDDLLTVHFPNIMLADSSSNPEGSKGFVQYQVKPKANLPHGTSIANTAHIFFDFNEAVVTNTTTNNFNQYLSIPEKSLEEFSLYPNPSSGNITIVNKNIGNETLNVRIHDLMGKSLVSEALNFKNGVSSLNTDLVSGSYFLVIENGAGVLSSYRLVIRK